MKKKEMKLIQAEVKAMQKKIADAGWKPLSCDKWGSNHFLKFGTDRLYKKEGQMLCKNCVLEELK